MSPAFLHSSKAFNLRTSDNLLIDSNTKFARCYIDLE